MASRLRPRLRLLGLPLLRLVWPATLAAAGNNVFPSFLGRAIDVSLRPLAAPGSRKHIDTIPCREGVALRPSRKGLLVGLRSPQADPTPSGRPDT